MSSSIRLTPAIKSLLTLRNPKPLSGPALSKLSPVFSKTYQDAWRRSAETGWLVLTTCALLTANRPESIGHLYRFVTRSEPSAPASTTLGDSTNKAALMRESALKSTIFVGVPRVIISLTALHEALEDDVKSSLRTESHRTATPGNVEAILHRGRSLWDELYDPHSAKLHAKLGSLHPDFIEFIIQAYGSVLAPLPPDSAGKSVQGNLSRALGSVVGTACLRAEGRVGAQQMSHVFGLLKARGVLENQSKEDAWLASDEGTEWVIRTVDEILDVVEDGSTTSADSPTTSQPHENREADENSKAKL